LPRQITMQFLAGLQLPEADSDEMFLALRL
jgi:hypothetical protein